MNVFVLCGGRCGSVTFAKACSHITNFTSGHETKAGKYGAEHFQYAENHIEVDNRLSWFLGMLDECYGDRAYYVHLVRDSNEVAASFMKRWGLGIISAYRGAMIQRSSMVEDKGIVLDYCETVGSNIRLFLKDKTKKLDIRLEEVKVRFPIFWKEIGAEGDLGKAIKEFDIRYNRS